MRTNENRSRYDRGKPRAPSDTADDEWSSIAPPGPPAERGGNKRTVNEREIVRRTDAAKFVATKARSF